MQKTRFIGIFTALVISTAIITGCSQQDASGSSAQTDASQTSKTSQTSQTSQTEQASAKVSIDGTKFTVDGKELWINGVNTPWQKWNDFTGNMDEASWEETFKQLKADHINCTRIWINCNGMSIVQLKTTGEFKSVKEGHWTDLDKLFALAEKYDVYVMPTLLSFDHFKDSVSGYDSWRKMITNKEYTDSFVQNYVVEFAKRYNNCDRILGVDIMNEPDWVYENKECGKIGWENLSYFFGECAAAIHENSDMLVTVGMGIIKYNSDKYEGDKISDAYLKELTGNDKAYVDFYSTHYYMWEKQYFGFPFDKSPKDFGIDASKPCLIGETGNDDEKESGMTNAEKYKSAYDNGWNGVMLWMDYRTDGSSGCDSLWYRYDLTQEATNSMYGIIPEKIYPLGEKE